MIDHIESKYSDDDCYVTIFSTAYRKTIEDSLNFYRLKVKGKLYTIMYLVFS
jgi:hypothetical protein